MSEGVRSRRAPHAAALARSHHVVTAPRLTPPTIEDLLQRIEQQEQAIKVLERFDKIYTN